MCAHEAIRRVAGEDQIAVRRELAKHLPASFREMGTPFYNDHPSTSHGAILALFDRAIEACGDA